MVQLRNSWKCMYADVCDLKNQHTVNEGLRNAVNRTCLGNFDRCFMGSSLLIASMLDSTIISQKQQSKK